jgi:hypothetical protein
MNWSCIVVHNVCRIVVNLNVGFRIDVCSSRGRDALRRRQCKVRPTVILLFYLVNLMI